jgi:hypothetical protein
VTRKLTRHANEKDALAPTDCLDTFRKLAGSDLQMKRTNAYVVLLIAPAMIFS